MSTVRLPPIYRAHLGAVTGPDPATVRDHWEADGVLEFPYAPAGAASRRLEGIAAIVDYFDGPPSFAGWAFTGQQAWKVEGAPEYVVEMHGSATLVATGASYEQDYIVRFGLSPAGRIAWMREFWDPTRMESRS